MQFTRGVSGIAMVAVALTLGACARTETVMMRVAPYESGCMGFRPGWCQLVSTDGSVPSHYEDSGIDGFRYRWGFEYWLLVHVRHLDKPPADASSIEYRLKDILEVRPVPPGTQFEIGMYVQLVENFDPDTGEGAFDDGRERFVVPSPAVRALLAEFLARDDRWSRGTASF